MVWQADPAGAPGDEEIAGFRPPQLIAQELAALIARRIVLLELAPGQRLVEEELGRTYHVSRSPIREVLRILETEGLVVRAPRRGIWVSPLSRADADEVYRCRVVLECLAAECAATRHAEVPPDKLLKSVEKLKSAAEDVRAYFEANVDFTSAVHGMAGNRTLSRLLRQLGPQGERYRYFAYLKDLELVRRSISGNERLAEAILEGRAATARALTEDLIRTSWERVRSHLKE